MLLDSLSDEHWALLQQAAEQFASDQFWVCHETLESIWLTAPQPHKTFYQGIIQVAAGCHHLLGGNRKGTLSLLRQGIEKLQAVQPLGYFQGWINLDPFLDQVMALRVLVEDPVMDDPSAFERLGKTFPRPTLTVFGA